MQYRRTFTVNSQALKHMQYMNAGPLFLPPWGKVRHGG